MASRFRFRARATALVRDLYAQLEAAAIAAARRNGWQLLCIPDSLGGVYGDSAGTTLPALNAPLGALLDRSFGVEALGPDALNGIGAFDSATGWTGGGGWTVAGGVATNSGVSADLTAAVNVVKGRQYVVSFRLTSYTAGANAPGIHNGVGAFVRASISRYSALGTCTEVLTATADGASSIVINAGSPCSIDELSVREVVPLAANLGPELVTNGGFDTASGWTADPGWSIAAGIASKVSGTGSLRRADTFVVGKCYQVECDSLAAGGPMNVIFGSTYTTPTTTVGRLRCIAVATGSGMLQFQGGGNFQLDNISVKEVYGYRATQATAANKPTLVRVPRKLGPARNAGTWTTAAGHDNVVSGSTASSFTSTGGTQANRAAQVLESLIPGRTYSLTLRCVSLTSGSLSIFIREGLSAGVGTVAFTNSVGITAAQTVAYTFVATTSAANALFVGSASSGQSYSVDGFVLAEVLDWSYAIQFDTSNDTLASTLPSTGTPGVIAFHNAGETEGYASASASGFTLGHPQLAGRAVSVIVASPTAIAEGPDLAAIRRFANHQRGLAL